MPALAWLFNAFLGGVLLFWITPLLAGLLRDRRIQHHADARDLELVVPEREFSWSDRDIPVPWPLSSTTQDDDDEPEDAQDPPSITIPGGSFEVSRRELEYTLAETDIDVDLNRYVEAITDFYYGLAMKMYHRALLVARKHGGYDIVATEFDTETGTEKASLGGQRKDWADPGGHMSRLYQRPFGVTHEESNVILTPQLMEIGEHLKQAAQNGQRELEIEYTDEQTTQTQTQRYQLGAIPIPQKERLVNAKDGLYALMCSGDPSLVDTSLTMTKKSQDPFSSGRASEMTMLLMAFLAGFGAMWFAGNNGGTAGLPKGESVGLAIIPLLSGVPF